MKFPWAISLAREDASSLAALRLHHGIEVAEANDLIWVRGQPADNSLAVKLAALPATGRFERLGSDQLRLLKERVPTRRLPDLPWQPMPAWLRVEIPTAAFPAQEPNPIALRLVRSGAEQEAELLLTTLSEFKRFVASAPQLRLRPLQFAANSKGDVLVRGKPLPPLPGQRFFVQGGVAVPAGFAWEPAVSVEVLARKLGAANDVLVLWNPNGTITPLHSEQFASATPSALRATEQTGTPPA